MKAKQREKVYVKTGVQNLKLFSRQEVVVKGELVCQLIYPDICTFKNRLAIRYFKANGVCGVMEMHEMCWLCK